MPNDFLEKTLEDLIFENRGNIHEKGLPRFKDKTFRQFYLPSGKKIDIISFSLSRGNIAVNLYELKKDFIDTQAICQAYNYLHEFKGLINNFYNSVEIKLIMVGKKYDPISILDGLKVDIEVYTYDYQMNGIQFYRKDILIKQVAPNNIFSNAMWAWGDFFAYPKGLPSSLNIMKEYLDYIKDENQNFDSEMDKRRKVWVSDIKLLPPSITATDYQPVSYWPWTPNLTYDESAYDDNSPHYETNE